MENYQFETVKIIVLIFILYHDKKKTVLRSLSC